ncbi:MAG TPA: chromate transporter [Chthonomonadaceae bacterium]|nr:chromate transporter [Chthonomonadaceae bacterium]
MPLSYVKGIGNIETSTETSPPRPSLWLLLRVWFLLGCQSFGGGTATLALIRRVIVEQRQWVSEAEFTRFWSLCQVAPGINLVAVTILIGRKLKGAPGILVSVLGLLLPSVAITILLTACYSRLEHLRAMQSALRGIIPATVGLGFMTAINIARPLIQESQHEGKGHAAMSLVLIVGALLLALWHKPVILVLLSAGLASGLYQWRFPSKDEAAL